MWWVIPPPSGRAEPPPVEAETPATVATVPRTAAMNGDDHWFYSVSPKEKEARKQEVTHNLTYHSYRTGYFNNNDIPTR